MGCHISKSPENTNSVETNQESGTVLLVPAAARNALSAEKESGKLLLTHTLQEVMEINPEDVGDLEHAATKIQATFRGHVARKQAEKVKQETDLSKQLEKLDSKGSGDEELDVDLSDPNLNKAAVKIQASFRGHMARKEVMETIDKSPESNP